MRIVPIEASSDRKAMEGQDRYSQRVGTEMSNMTIGSKTSAAPFYFVAVSQETS